MALVIASAVMTLACQGCVSASPHEMARIEPAVPPTLGMTMAMPQAPVQGQPARLAPELSVHINDSLPSRFSGTPMDLGGEIAAQIMTGSPFELPLPVGLSVQTGPSPSWSGSPALNAIAAEQSRMALMRPSVAERNIAAEVAISAPRSATGLRFDVGLAPRIAVRDDGNVLTQRVGGEVRIGQNFNLLSKDGQPEGWYIFAGADGEALIWDADRSGFRPQLGDMALTDQVTVGDMQAGISIQRAGGQLSLSYIRREVKYQDRNGSLSENEDFAGVSFTMRR